MSASERDIGIASLIWCEPRHSSKEMDFELAESIAEALAAARLEGVKAGLEAAADYMEPTHHAAAVEIRSINAEQDREGGMSGPVDLKAIEATIALGHGSRAVFVSSGQLYKVVSALREAVETLRKIETIPIPCRGDNCPGCDAGRTLASIRAKVVI